MPDTTAVRGARKTVLASASRAAGNYTSNVYWLPNGGYHGLIIVLVVTAIAAGGQITQIELQAEDNGVLTTVATFDTSIAAGIPITAIGVYRFRVSPAGALMGATGYTGAVDDVAPSTGAVKVTHGVAAMAYAVKVEAL